jgi:hypothetical protein
MVKKIFFVIVILIMAVVVYWIYQGKSKTKVAFDPLNASYSIDGVSFALINGKAEKGIPGSASKIEVSVWGEPALGDLNSEPANDAALILAYSGGGSGVFYYAVAAIRNPQDEKAIGTNGILLGDRIAPQNISIANKIITVNYADRKSTEPFTTQPSVGITRIFSIDGTSLKEITSDSAKKEQACSLAGGTITASLCCASAADFPNSCLIGACGCAPANSHQIKTCDCGQGKCFDGKGCVAVQ